MKKNLLGIFFCGILLFGLSGCKNENNHLFKINEKFMNGTTLNDGRHVSFTFDVPYNDGYLSEALLYNEITIDEFVNKLKKRTILLDSGRIVKDYKEGEFVNEGI